MTEEGIHDPAWSRLVEPGQATIARTVHKHFRAMVEAGFNEQYAFLLAKSYHDILIQMMRDSGE